MVLSAKERGLVKSLWTKIAPRSRELGAEVFKRLFLNYPQTKAFYPHFDFDGSADLLNHGEKMFNALGNAISNLNNHHSHPHANKLTVEPKIFKPMSKTMKDVLADHFPDDFTSEAKAAWDKFLSEVSTDK